MGTIQIGRGMAQEQSLLGRPGRCNILACGIGLAPRGVIPAPFVLNAVCALYPAIAQ